MVAAAIVGGSIIGGVATTMAGKKASSAQENAAKDSNATQLAMYNQTRADLAPFRETGYQALGSLAHGLGLQPYQAPGANAGRTEPLDYNSWVAQNGSVTKKQFQGRLGYKDVVDQPATQAKYQDYVTNFVPTKTGTTIDNETGQPVADPTFGDLNRDFTLADFNADPGYQFRMDQGSNALERSAAARGGLMNGGTLKALTRYGQDFASNEYSNAYNRFNNDRTQRFNRLAAVAGIGQTATNTTASLGANTANNVAENQIAVGNARAANAINTGNAVNNTVGTLGQFYLSRQYGASAGAGAGSSAGTSAYNYTGPVYSNYV